MMLAADLYKIEPRMKRISNQLVQFYNNGNFLQNTAYLLLDNKKALIIDPSFLGSYLLDFCSKNDLEIVAILLTHGHWDHWIFSRQLLEAVQLPIYCHQADQPLFAVALERMHTMDPNFDEKHLINDLIVFCDWTDGQELCFHNFKLNVLHTPGHSPGSVCFATDHYIFSGDHVFATSVGRTDLYLSQPQLMLTSLKKFFSTYNESQIILPGHLDQPTRVYEARAAIGQLFDLN